MAKKKKKIIKSKKKSKAKKKISKKTKSRPKSSKPKKVTVPKKEKVTVIGIVTHYFPKVNAAVVKLKRPLSLGDQVVVKGKTTQFEQKIESMQIDHVALTQAKKGDEIGLQVKERVREHDVLILPQ